MDLIFSGHMLSLGLEDLSPDQSTVLDHRNEEKTGIRSHGKHRKNDGNHHL